MNDCYMNVKITSDGRCEISTGGSAAEKAAMIAGIAGSLYLDLRHRDPKHARAFRKVLQDLIDDDSPTWRPQSFDGMVSANADFFKRGHEDA